MKRVRPSQLFVYGTLKSCFRNRASGALRSMALFQAQATIGGSLHLIGWYPAVKLYRRGKPVEGEVFKLKNVTKALRCLDRYEQAYAFGRDYRREPVWARSADGTRYLCQTYVYNLPCKNFPAIVSGRFGRKRSTK
ncbi:MAG: gamma-glutamylcyclotransferase family protein [Breznakibacter sp.]